MWPKVRWWSSRTERITMLSGLSSPPLQFARNPKWNLNCRSSGRGLARSGVVNAPSPSDIGNPILQYCTFSDYRYPCAARTFFTRWFWRATHSRLKSMTAVAKVIPRHLPNLLTYLRHRLTNAGLEGVNAVIQWVQKTARGFRNAEHFKTAIYFHCGGLDLYPHETR